MTKTLEEQLREGLIAPGTPFQLKQSIEISFNDDTIAGLQESFKKIQLTESAGSTDKRKLLVTVEGIHTGMTKNKTFYPGNTLEASVPTWTTPHHKPVLKNHNEYSEPLGRIVGAEYGESTITDKFTVKLKLEITDNEAIEKVLDGRYLTLSVGGSANKVTCSVCAKDLVTEGYCGHRRGQTYEGKEAYWMISNYTGDEISFVNMPADVHAQVIAAELVSEKGGKPVTKEQTDPENNTPVQTQENTQVDPLELIDGLTTNENTGGTADPVDPPAATPPATPAVPTQEGATNEEDAEKIKTLEARVTELEGTLATREAENTTLTGNLAEAKDDLAKANEKLESAETECKKMVEQNTTLARYARKTLVERIADLRSLHTEESVDRAAVITEFKESSSKVLEQQITDLLAKQPTRTPQHVPNPGLAQAENNAPIVDEEGNDINVKKQVESKPLPTLKQLESTMTKSMFRQNQ